MAKGKFAVTFQITQAFTSINIFDAEEEELTEKIDEMDKELRQMICMTVYSFGQQIESVSLDHFDVYKVKEVTDEQNEVKLVLEKIDTRKIECPKLQPGVPSDETLKYS
mgnify:CR=1 FL=1